MSNWILVVSLLNLPLVSQAKTITTNSVLVVDAPKWLRSIDVRKVTNKIEYKLEWSTRRVNVHFHTTQKDFDRVHSLGSRPTAVTISRGEKSVIHLGPKVDKQNFPQIFGHEMVHVIINQKYKGAIPKWLEEGLANHLSKKKKVDYAWLKKHSFPADVRSLSHPFKGNKDKIRYRYMASQALVEMLARKCDLDNLIRLSVQRKMENYIRTYCEIKDLNLAFRNWVNKKG